MTGAAPSSELNAMVKSRGVVLLPAAVAGALTEGAGLEGGAAVAGVAQIRLTCTVRVPGLSLWANVNVIEKELTAVQSNVQPVPALLLELP